MKKNVYKRVLLSACISTALLGIGNLVAQPSQAKIIDKISKLPAGLLRDRLESLPDAARKNAQRWLGSFNFDEKDLPFLRIDDEGGVYYADTYLPNHTHNHTEEVDSGTSTEPMSENATVSGDVFTLHSKRGASNVIYLDFDGHVISGTAWSRTDLHAVPYDLNGDMNRFNDAERASIAEVWRRISEDYAPFDIDVTTELPASFGSTTGRLLITKDVDANGVAMPAQGAGGVAYVNVFGRSDYVTRYSPALVYYNNLGNGRADYVAEAASHEMGHNMGLSHDATNTRSYYGGHGTGSTSWGPIMGTGYGRNVSQWSKGEYAGANQYEDDIAIIANKTQLRADDHADLSSQATPLAVDANGHIASTTPANDPDNTATSNKGIISTRDDIDVFSLNTSAGNITLQALPGYESRYTRGANLDVLLSLYDQSGTLIASSNPDDDTDAGINRNVTAGLYYLSVQGTDSANYTDYGSLGQYFIEGFLPVAVDDVTAPTPNPMGWSVTPRAVDRTSITMTAVTATDDTSNVEYYFKCVGKSGSCADSGWQTSPQFTASKLSVATSYSFQVKARDASGNETVASSELSATTLSNSAPTAGNDSGSVQNDSSLTLNVLQNDLDSDDDALVITAVSQVNNGSVSYTDSHISYTPDSGFVGLDNFTYSISDGFGGSATASIRINVTKAPVVNQPPTAIDDAVKVVRNSSTVIAVLDNDSDPENDKITIISVSQGSKGRVTTNGTQITYIAGRSSGADSFSYRVSDGHGGTDTATVNVSISGRGSIGGLLSPFGF